MSGPEFFQTGMGRTFYEGHVPRLVTALERIADALEKHAPVEVTGPRTKKPHRKAQPSAARESSTPPRRLLARPEDFYAVVRDMFPAEQEAFVVVAMDIRNGMIGEPTIVALGTVHEVEVHPREVFRDAVRKAASAILVAHNHPSGDPTPSKEDVELTKRLRSVGEMIGIPVIDHVVVGANGYRSIAEWMGSEL